MNQPTIISEGDDYFVLDKPAGYAVEPVANYPSISDWLVEKGKIFASDWPLDGRLGVVHRTDVDTSGLLIWAKTPASQENLKRLWQGRVVEKTYIGLAVGKLPERGTVEVAIRRDNQKDRQTAALLPDKKARPAITEFQRLKIATIARGVVSMFEAKPITGRTHQIRVHLKYLGHPVIGDKLYGDKASRSLAKELNLTRHFLHAWKLSLPWQGKKEHYESPLQSELAQILRRLNLNP